MNNYIILKSTEEKILYPGKIEKLKFEYHFDSPIIPHYIKSIKLPKRIITNLNDPKISKINSIMVVDRYLDTLLYSYSSISKQRVWQFDIKLLNIFNCDIKTIAPMYIKIKNPIKG